MSKYDRAHPLINKTFLVALVKPRVSDMDAASAAGSAFIRMKMNQPSLMQSFAEEMPRDAELRKLHITLKGVLANL